MPNDRLVDDARIARHRRRVAVVKLAGDDDVLLGPEQIRVRGGMSGEALSSSCCRPSARTSTAASNTPSLYGVAGSTRPTTRHINSKTPDLRRRFRPQVQPPQAARRAWRTNPRRISPSTGLRDPAPSHRRLTRTAACRERRTQANCHRGRQASEGLRHLANPR
jgi:hypothetical protein